MGFTDAESRARDYEALIRRIRDVISARVMISPEGLVEAIHVLASGNRGAKQLVRDVESSLMAQGLQVDHKKISVALLSPEAQDTGGHRARILGFSLARSGRIVEARVKLEFKGAAAEGTAQGPGTNDGRNRALAEATLSAVQRYITAQSELFLEDCGLVQIGSKKAATVCVVEFDAQGERTLLGSSLCKQDETESFIRATLDAVNRRLPVWAALSEEQSV
jgi:predicted nucleic-acid-binding protein